MPDIEIIHEEFKRRRRARIGRTFRTLALWLVLLFLGCLLFSPETIFPAGGPEKGRDHLRSKHGARRSFLTALGFQKETLYTFMPSWLEINLDSQKLYQHWKTGSVDSFPISTGNPLLNKGIETTEGIFLVQNKFDWLYSLQFDSTKVFNWLGFHYGIGFHSLAGSRYYATLGRRRSSHGCVRMRREDAEKLYRSVGIGTPVMVHSANYVRMISFIRDPETVDTACYTRAQARSIFESRLRALYRGEKYYRNYPILPLQTRYVTHEGLAIGDTLRVPRKQKVPRISDFFAIASAEWTRVHASRPVPRWSGAEPADTAAYESIIRP